MDMDFIGYEKIVERPEEWRLDESGYRRLRSVDWVVSEKIHGANFVAATDGRNVRFAKRKAWLEPEEEFFGYQLLAPSLAAKSLLLFSRLRQDVPYVNQVFIYGELFGGAYPHPAVSSDPRAAAVQTGVYYSPSVEYAVFDIATVDESGERRYLPAAEALRWGEACGFLAVKPLFIGSYTKAVDYPLGFESTIPAQLGLPPLPKGNKAEGVVMKPVSTVVAASGRIFRPVLKRKIPEFNEDARYDGAQKWRPVAEMIGNEQAAFQLLAEFVPLLLTPARFSNAQSKVGRFDAQTKAPLAQFIDSVWEDVRGKFIDDQADLWGQLSPLRRRELELAARKIIWDWAATLTSRQDA